MAATSLPHTLVDSRHSCMCHTATCRTQLAELQRQAAANGRKLMDAYFERMRRLTASPRLESRLRFMLMDVMDQRQRGWEARRKKEGPKKIEVCACV